MKFPFLVISPRDRLTGKEKRVGGFDLIWNDGPVAVDDIGGADCMTSTVFTSNSFLGKLYDVFTNESFLRVYN